MKRRNRSEIVCVLLIGGMLALMSGSASAQVNLCALPIIQQNAAAERTQIARRSCPPTEDVPACIAQERKFLAMQSDGSGAFTRLERNRQRLEGFFIERGNDAIVGYELTIFSDGSFDGFISARNSDGSISSLEFAVRDETTNSGLAVEAGTVVLVLRDTNFTVDNQFCTAASPRVFSPLPPTARVYLIDAPTVCGRPATGVQSCPAIVGTECPSSGQASSCSLGTCEGNGVHTFYQYFRLTCR